MSAQKRVLLIIGGGIAAFKTPELVRELSRQGFAVRCLLTAAGAQFVSPLTLASVSGDHVYENLFDLTDEADMGHIQLSRDADLILVAPATADLIAKMAQGVANDLASTTLLATDKKVAIAPAMNVRMWHHPATQRNLAQLHQDAIHIIGPDEGDMACGEFGLGRMREPRDIVQDIVTELSDILPNRSSSKYAPDPMINRPLHGRHALVTAGPTHEPIDPVRYIANRSSGKQGYAIAEALAQAGARVTLITGPTALATPPLVDRVNVETGLQMQAAVQAHLPADIAIMTAAVADWRPDAHHDQKIKKTSNGKSPTLSLVPNPDILAELCQDARKPPLVIGFAAETENLEQHAQEKFKRKGCDWLVANNVSAETGVMGGDFNTVSFLTAQSVEQWPQQSKVEVAQHLVDRISAFMAGDHQTEPQSRPAPQLKSKSKTKPKTKSKSPKDLKARGSRR